MNWISIFVAAVVPFVIGGIWYTALFGKRWQHEAKLTDEQVSAGAAKVFLGSFLLFLILAGSLSMYIGDDPERGFGTFAGFLAGATWVTPLLGVIYLFERRSFTHFLINAGYAVVALTSMGFVLDLF